MSSDTRLIVQEMFLLLFKCQQIRIKSTLSQRFLAHIVQCVLDEVWCLCSSLLSHLHFVIYGVISSLEVLYSHKLKAFSGWLLSTELQFRPKESIFSLAHVCVCISCAKPFPQLWPFFFSQTLAVLLTDTSTICRTGKQLQNNMKITVLAYITVLAFARHQKCAHKVGYLSKQ